MVLLLLEAGPPVQIGDVKFIPLLSAIRSQFGNHLLMENSLLNTAI